MEGNKLLGHHDPADHKVLLLKMQTVSLLSNACCPDQGKPLFALNYLLTMYSVYRVSQDLALSLKFTLERLGVVKRGLAHVVREI